MARGWESKAVETQIESSESDAGSHPRQDAGSLTPERVEAMREKDNLLLSRKRVQHDLEASTNPRYQQMLRAALAHLDRKLAQF